LDGLRLIIPKFSRDPSAAAAASAATEHHRPRRALIPGVYYVFYQPPESATAAAAAVKSPPSDHRRPVRPRGAAAKSSKACPRADDEPPEPLEGLYDRRQVKRKQQVLADRRRALTPATKAFPICEIGGVTYILNPNTEIIVGLLRPPKQ